MEITKKPKNKDDYRKYIADTFIKCLETEQLDWKKTWMGIDNSMPKNAVNGKDYKGINSLLLGCIAYLNGYSDNRWATMVQIIDKNGTYHPKNKWHLKAGSKASYVQYWYQYDCVNKKAVSWEEYKQLISKGRDQSEFRLSARYTPVFNASCIEGVPEQKKELVHNDINQDELIDKLSKNMNVEIIHDGGDQSYYSIKNDNIHLPLISAFESDASYNATVLHELAHATGHPTRLNRDIKNTFGSEQYAFEELIAEISSCFMAQELKSCDCESIDNNIAYVQGWISEIKKDPNILVKAIKEAQSVANYMDYKAELITDKEYNNNKDNESSEETNHDVKNTKEVSQEKKSKTKENNEVTKQQNEIGER